MLLRFLIYLRTIKCHNKNVAYFSVYQFLIQTPTDSNEKWNHQVVVTVSTLPKEF